MPKMDDLFPSKWLKYSDLPDDGQCLTILDVTVEAVGEDDKPCLRFNETTKIFGCNKTNARTMFTTLGTDTDEWIGKKVFLFPTQCDFQGEQVDCIRVNKRKTETANIRPAAAKPATKQTAPPVTQEEADADIPF